MSAAVSVVVPTCGRPELLRRCVAALEAQTLPAAQYEMQLSCQLARTSVAE